MKRNIAFASVLALFALWIGLSVMQAHASAKSRNQDSAAETWPRNDRNDRPYGHEQRPNIVFIILDDVGIDQMALYSFGGDDPAAVPSIEAIAAGGMRFSNVWAMPECSPTRSTFFTGRYPFRTGVTSAIIPQMIPQAQVSPYETTLPRLLSTAGYKSAMMGKYHLGSENPSGNCAPSTRGWDFFDGNMEAGPPSIDTMAGTDTTPPGTYQCGFVRAAEEPNGNASGACYFIDSTCQDDLAGKACLELGGVLIAGEVCSNTPPPSIDFEATNGYYVWPETLNQGRLPAPSHCIGSGGPGCAPITCPIDAQGEPPLLREYMSTVQTETGIDWWHEQTGPRMLTVSYNAIHTPYQQPPDALGGAATQDRLCQARGQTGVEEKSALANAMFESMDSEIARLLEGLELATLNGSGTIESLHLDERNTMLVVVGDNGTFAPVVKSPFDPFHSKGTVYQTGVWVPLVVAGPLVQGMLGREVNAPVNTVDLFELFAEIAGINVREVVPPAHGLDSASMLPYLSESNPSAIRDFNLTQLAGAGTLATPVAPENRLWPCITATSVNDDDPDQVLLEGGACSDLLFDTQAFCSDNGGLWFGPDGPFPNPNAKSPDTPDGAWNSCCDVLSAMSSASNPPSILPVEQWAVQNGDFKLIERTFSDCDVPSDDPKVFPPFETITSVELYDLRVSEIDYLPTEICTNIDLANPSSRLACNDGTSSLALPGGNPCANAPACFGPADELRNAYGTLMGQLGGTRSSEVACPGDGNLDKRVNELDLIGVDRFLDSGPSYFDFNKDGETDAEDRAIVLANLGTDCLGACRRADLNHDQRVNAADATLLQRATGPCNVELAADPQLCAADLDGDGKVDKGDLAVLLDTERTFKNRLCPLQVIGHNDPAIDPDLVQAALDQAFVGPAGVEVQLLGTFDFGDCNNCVTVRGPMSIQGSGDPSEDTIPTHPVTMIASSGLAPFVINHLGSENDVIRIERLWFKGGLATALNITQLRGRLELIDNRISGFAGLDEFRFGVSSAGALFLRSGGVLPIAGELTGRFHAEGNYIDNRDVPFEKGDDNGFALQGCAFSRIDIVDNKVFTRGESIEVEGCTNPEASIRVIGNTIISDAAVSTLAGLSDAVGIDRDGGHPAALKVLGNRAAQVHIRENLIRVTGFDTAVCIETGSVNPDGRTQIRHNRCDMSGQFAAILGGWAGEPGFPPSFLQNAAVTDNVFTGRALFGVAMADFKFLPSSTADLVNEAHNNTFRRNDFSGFRSDRAVIYLGPSTHDNRFFGNPNGPVEDLGTNNSTCLFTWFFSGLCHYGGN